MTESEQTAAARRYFLAQLAWAETLRPGDRVYARHPEVGPDGPVPSIRRILCVTGIRPAASLPLAIWGYFEDDPQQAGVEQPWQGVTPLPDGEMLRLPLPSPGSTQVAR